MTMTHESRTTFRTPSNRSFIAQMVKWGWTEGRQNGRWQTMHGAPLLAMAGQTIQVRPATQHDANPTSVFKDVYRLTCGGDADMFWRGPSDAYLQLLAKTIADADTARRRAVERDIERATQRAARAATAATPAAPTAPPIVEAPTTRKEKPVAPRNLKLDITSSQILTRMARHDRVFSIRDVADEFGLDPDDNEVKQGLYARVDLLTRNGGLVRVKRGVYRISPSYRSVTARVAHDHADVHDTTVPTPPPVEPVVATTAAPWVLPAQETVDSIDDTIEAVLDLLLPNGFKASHLRYIAPWVEATKQMVQAVGG